MIKTQTREVIEVRDWDEFVETHYNKIYSFQQQDGCQSRGVYDFKLPNQWGCEDYENEDIPIKINGEEMGVSFKAWMDKDLNDKFFQEDSENRLFWKRNFYPNIEVIIDDLYNKGLLKDGKYSINIDW